jgi:hypothetical protein
LGGSTNITTGGAGVNVQDNTTGTGTFYPLLSVQTSGALTTSNTSSTRLTFVPNTGTLSATVFSGSFSGSGSGLTGTASSLTAGAVSSITTAQVTSALGVTNTTYSGTMLTSANYSSYITSGAPTQAQVTSALGITNTTYSGTMITSSNYSSYFTVPTYTSQLTNNSGYITSASLGSYATTSTSSWSPSSGTFGVSGSITASGNITAYYSDMRLKNKLGNIDNALTKVMSLNGFYFEPNEIAQELGYELKTEVGVSAQEVQKILPEIVVPAPIDDKYLTVHYEKLIPLLIEAIKELKTELDELKSGK